jgi:uncharacterized protein with HEPN domain
MPPRDAAALEDMLAHAREAAALMQGKSRVDLDNNRVLSLALVRLLEIVGEAASRVSAVERTRHTAIPWAEIVSLRNRLIHGYASVDMEIVWEILRRDVPALIAELERIVPRRT